MHAETSEVPSAAERRAKKRGTNVGQTWGNAQENLKNLDVMKMKMTMINVCWPFEGLVDVTKSVRFVNGTFRI